MTLTSKLALFIAALVGLAWAVFSGSITAVLVTAAVVVATVVLGERFAVKLPHVHLSEVHVPLVL